MQCYNKLCFLFNIIQYLILFFQKNGQIKFRKTHILQRFFHILFLYLSKHHQLFPFSTFGSINREILANLMNLVQNLTSYNQFIMYSDNNQKNNKKNMTNSLSLYESTTTIKSISLKESQLIKKFKEPPDISLYQMKASKSQNEKSTTSDTNMKVKKFQSVETNSTQQNGPTKQEQTFISKYNQDPMFRIKIQNMRKEHQKLKEKNQISIGNETTDNKITTWRSQKQIQNKQLIILYQCCKKWIQKVKNKN